MLSASLKFLSFWLILTFFSPGAWALDWPEPKDAELNLYTFGSGKNLEAWWGHNALGIRDFKNNSETLYNWGMYNFDRDLLRDFTKGSLRFWVAETPLTPTLQFYRHQNRSIYKQHLALSEIQKASIIKAVRKNMLLENKEYNYNYFNNNCSTKIRDLLNNALDDEIKQRLGKVFINSTTQRQQVHLLTAPFFVLGNLIDLVLGKDVDRKISKWDEMFLPINLYKYIKDFYLSDKQNALKPLVAQEEKIFISDFNSAYHYNPLQRYLNLIFLSSLSGVGCLLLLVLYKQKILGFKQVLFCFYALNTVVASILFVIGILFGYLMFFTEHTYTYFNQNFLLCNPLILVLAGCGFWGLKATLKILGFFLTLSLAALLIKLFPQYHQDNLIFIVAALTYFALMLICNLLLIKTSTSSKIIF